MKNILGKLVDSYITDYSNTLDQSKIKKIKLRLQESLLSTSILSISIKQKF